MTGSGNKSQITTVGCVNAAGHCIPSMAARPKALFWLRMRFLAPFMDDLQKVGSIKTSLTNGLTTFCAIPHLPGQYF